MKNNFIKFFLFAVCIQFTVGCGALTGGISDHISIDSNPNGAGVWIDGVQVGTTPLRVSLMSDKNYLVNIKKEGYKETIVNIDLVPNMASGFGYLILIPTFVLLWIQGEDFSTESLGGILIFIIDVFLGGTDELEPNKINVDLEVFAGKQIEKESNFNRASLRW